MDISIVKKWSTDGSYRKLAAHRFLRCHSCPFFCRGRQAGDLLSSHSPRLLRKRLAVAWEQLGLSVPYRWYSVGRRGATYIYRTTNNIAAVCVSGRWNVVKIAKIYISDGVAQLSELALPPSKQRRLKQLASSCRPDFELCS